MPHRVGDEAVRWHAARQGTAVVGSLTGDAGATSALPDTSTAAPPTTTPPPTTSTPPPQTTPTTAPTSTTPASSNDSGSTSGPASQSNGSGSGSSAAGGSTAAGTSAAVSTGGNTSPTTASYTSMIQETVVVTQNGSTVVTVSQLPTLVPVTSGGSKGSNNTGPIVGGVVGGIALLALLILLFWWIKRRTKKIELDGDIFDPDRTAQRPGRLPGGDLDLMNDPQTLPHPYNLGRGSGEAAAAGAGAVGVGAAAAAVNNRRQSQQYYNQPGPAPGGTYNYNQQYGQTPYPPMTTINGRPASFADPRTSQDYNRAFSQGHSDPSTYPTSPYTSSSGHPTAFSPTSGTGPGSDGGRSGSAGGLPYLMPGPISGTGTTSSRSAKAQQAQQMHLTNAPEDASGPVHQHLDGGRYNPEPGPSETPPTEVPPAYDSIPVEEAQAAGSSSNPSAGLAARQAAARPEKSSRPLS